MFGPVAYFYLALGLVSKSLRIDTDGFNGIDIRDINFKKIDKDNQLRKKTSTTEIINDLDKISVKSDNNVYYNFVESCNSNSYSDNVKSTKFYI